MRRILKASKEILEGINDLPNLIDVEIKGAGSSCTGCYIEEHTENSMSYWNSYCVPSGCSEGRDSIKVKGE